MYRRWTLARVDKELRVRRVSAEMLIKGVPRRWLSTDLAGY